MLTITDMKNVLPFTAAYKEFVHAEMLKCPKEDLSVQRDIYDAFTKFETRIKNDLKNENHPFLNHINGEK
ncbi:TPA: hypothetical protein RFX42_005310 [Klebsiella pneumoniae subsp. ozaenae]|nr:hypothetical protein [Klebsiella pneumoniae subsp. ozaenae]